MNTKHILVGGCLTLACAVGAYAQTPTPSRPAAAPTQQKSPMDAQRDAINAQHKADMDKCKGLEGNAKDVCKEEADARRKVARAELKVKEKDSAENRRDLEKAKAEASYDVAKEKCDDQKGDAKDACVKEAKAKRDMALANAAKPNQRAKSQ
jgi:hypothetical protein